jgi:stalled ribosome rescue protein Dom34
MSKHVAVWIDHKEAHIFRVHPGSVEQENVVAPQHVQHRHPKGAAGDKNHPDDEKRFFEGVAHALEGSEELLLLGPSTTKLRLLRYLEKQVPALGSKVVGIETVDHPTDRQLIAQAKAYFIHIDPLL